MLGEMRIEWGPGAVTHQPNGEISLGLNCILVPKHVWSSWPLPPQRTSQAERYVQRLATTGSQPFAQNQPDWTWKKEIAIWMTLNGPLKLVEPMWYTLAPLAVRGPILGASTTLNSVYLLIFFVGGISTRAPTGPPTPTAEGLNHTFGG